MERLAALRVELLAGHIADTEELGQATREHRHMPSTVQDHTPSGLLAHRVAEAGAEVFGAVIDPHRDDDLRARIAPAIQERQQEFPGLGAEDWEPVAEGNASTNCHAHSVGADRWLQPAWEFEIWDFDRLFAEHGFAALDDLDLELRPGIEKVVVYALQPGDDTYRHEASRYLDSERFALGGPLCQHSARQEADGTWTMKLDADGIIKVADLDVVNGPKYGRPFKVYARARTG